MDMPDIADCCYVEMVFEKIEELAQIIAVGGRSMLRHALLKADITEEFGYSGFCKQGQTVLDCPSSKKEGGL